MVDRIDRRALIAAALALPLAGGSASQAASSAPEQVPLWPGPPPGAASPPPVLAVEHRPSPGGGETWLTGIAVPTITIHRPARANGVGLLAMPGGGYQFLAITNEGDDVARAFTALGYTVAVLTYRLPAEGWRRPADVPLQDAQRAMRLFRTRAAGVARFGVLGFSAGGHLAASLATAYGERVYDAVDAADRLPARPDFAGLLYAVTTLEPPETHAETRLKLLGDHPTDAAVARRSPMRHVDAATPPCFLLHAFDDTIVPVACSLGWTAACRAAGIPIEAHLIERGGHGFGVHLPRTNPGALWPELFHRWVGQHG